MAEEDIDGRHDMTGVERHHLVAALSYLGILVLVPLLFVDKDVPFVKFHAKQGLVILIGYVLAIIGVGFLPVIGDIFWVALGVASIAGLIQALQGKWWKIPLIGQLAEKFRI